MPRPVEPRSKAAYHQEIQRLNRLRLSFTLDKNADEALRKRANAAVDTLVTACLKLARTRAS